MICELSIARFKAIRRVTLPLRSLNLFVGINGMGKSTCLQSLLLLRQSWIARTLPQSGLLLRGSLVDLGRGVDVLHQFEDEESIEFAVKTAQGSMKWVFAVGEDQGFEHEVLSISNVTSTYKSAIEAYDHPPFTAGFRYLSAERIRPEVAYETSFYSVRELDQIGSRGEFAVHYLAEHRNRALEIVQLKHASLSANQSDLLSNVRAWMGELSPGISLDVQHYPGIQKAEVAYEYDTGPVKRFSSPLRPTNVGFGITYALPIVVAALSSKAGDTLLVENPESHLHPSGQAKIGRMLAIAAEAGVQVFVETHSDHVLNGIRLGVKNADVRPDEVAIFSFDRPAGDTFHDVHVVSPKVDRHGKIDKWPVGFFDETEKLLFELL
jgi:predicted ATPase